jgi:retinol dehydrogenase-12
MDLQASIEKRMLFPFLNVLKKNTLFSLAGVLQFATYILWKSVPQGAATTCYVGLNPQLKGVTGQYFADCNVEKTSRFARNDALAKQLWEFSEKLIKSSSK